MDPDANLREQREIKDAILRIYDAAHPVTGKFSKTQEQSLCGYATRLAELCETLDDWIAGGGFLPARWQKGQTR